MINESIKITGTVSYEHYDSEGILLESKTFPNLVVTAGKTFIASRMASAASAVMGWIEVGTSGTAPAAGDTALGAAVVSSRTATTVSGGTPSTNTLQFQTTFGAGVGTGALQEAGIFNAASAGTMLARTTFATINKAAGDTLTIYWTITVG